MDNSKNTAKICYWVQNLVNNKRSELQKIADAPMWACKKPGYGELEYQEFRHYFNVTAGDYDGDGKMTAVITYVGNDDLWGIAGTGIAGEQGLSRKSFVKSKGSGNAYFDGWNTTLYERDQITKSLVSADIDRDGCDELIVYAALPSRIRSTAGTRRFPAIPSVRLFQSSRYTKPKTETSKEWIKSP